MAPDLLPSVEAYFPADCSERLATVVIPRPFHNDAREIAAESPVPHPVWTKLRSRGEQMVVVTSELGDIEELADFAMMELCEPRKQPNKIRKDSCKAMLDRCYRVAELEIIGHNHVLATAWRPSPLVGARFPYKDN